MPEFLILKVCKICMHSSRYEIIVPYLIPTTVLKSSSIDLLMYF
jgi:hypothetical protein